MVRSRSFTPITAIALAVALVFQTLFGCSAAHASAMVKSTTIVASGHCDDMSSQQAGSHHSDIAEPDGGSAVSDGSPIEKSHDCAKMCHPIALQATTTHLVRIALNSTSLDAQPLDELLSSIARPATPPPKNG